MSKDKSTKSQAPDTDPSSTTTPSPSSKSSKKPPKLETSKTLQEIGYSDLLKVWTPACLARTVSRGKWEPANHLRAMDEVITEFIHSNHLGTAKSRILILDAPPRHGKSVYISQYLSAWHMGAYPHMDVILASYEGSFARSWGRKALHSLTAIVDDETNKTPADYFGIALDPTQSATQEWSTLPYGGTMRTSGARGSITGRGAHLFIIDDPIKNAEEALSPTIRENTWDWYLSTALTRLEPGGCLILMATRWHRDDLTGRLLEQSRRGDGEPVTHIHLPAVSRETDTNDYLQRKPGQALWPERWPIESLERIHRSQSTFWWEAMYQGRPTHSDVTEWPASYFGDHIWCDDTHWPDLSQFKLRLLAVDPSKGRTDRPGDPSAIVFVGVQEKLIYVDCSICRRPVERIVHDTLQFCERYRPHMLAFEGNAFQDLLAAQFEQATQRRFGLTYPTFMFYNTVPKVMRIRRLDPYLRHHEFRFRTNPDCRELVRQLEDFPLCDCDDGPDALEMAIRLPLEAPLQTA